MIFTPLVIFRRNLKTHRVEYLLAPTPDDLVQPVWVPTMAAATRFQQATARRIRTELAGRVNHRRWRVTVWDSRKPLSVKPVLTGINWNRTNRSIAAEYKVSESTVGNWRVRARAVPARRGGPREGAGRKAE